MSKAFVCNQRATIVFATIAMAFAVLLGRLIYLHTWDHTDLLEQIESSRRMVKVLKARRGNVVDCQGNLLATTHTTVNIGVDPQAVLEVDAAKLKDLAKLLGKPIASIEDAIATKTKLRADTGDPYFVRWAPLAKNLDQDTADAVNALKIKGVYGNNQFSRTYPGEKLAAHILGFINKQSTPVFGIERSFDFYLRGQDGWFETERDGRRRELAQYREREVLPTDGLNVQLCIDQMVQHIAEGEIERLVGQYNPESVSIIVSKPATGAVMALANYPTYNPNEYFNTTKYPIANQRNRALTDTFEPGSTFKIVPIAGAIEEGIVKAEHEFATNLSSVTYKGRNLGLPKDKHIKVDRLNLHNVIVKSSNRGSAQVGMLLGEQKLYDYATAFGYGSKTGCDLSGESTGILHSVNNWDRLTITRLPIGHAVSATPLQVHFAMSVMANYGVLMEPLLVDRIFDSSGNEVIRFSPNPKRRVISTKTAETVIAMLTDVVEFGTARHYARMNKYSVAGKTGTTQKIVDGRYSESQHIASFSGFLPASNPELVITVVVDHPKGVRASGGKICGPAFKNIAEACIAYLGIRADKQPTSLALKKAPNGRIGRVAN